MWQDANQLFPETFVEAYWKVKDGLFVGTREAAADHDFLLETKITRIINCAGHSVANSWDNLGVKYLTFKWTDTDRQIILDDGDAVANEVFQFVEEGLLNSEGVLIHSVYGHSRSYCLAAAYLMKKFRWSLQITHEYLRMNQLQHQLKPAFQEQLAAYEKRLMSQSELPFRHDWDSPVEGEELLLRNTTCNGQPGPIVSINSSGLYWKPQKLKWNDNMSGSFARLQKPPGSDRHNLENGKLILKSIVKGKTQKKMQVESNTVPGPPENGLPETRKRSPGEEHRPTQQSMVQEHSQINHRTRKKKQVGFRVFRFLLCFEPPVLAVDWGKDLRCDVNGLAEPTNSLNEKTRTNIEFSSDDFVDLNALAAKVILQHSFLSNRHLDHIRLLLRQLASSCLPVYQVVHHNGALLCTDLNIDRRHESGNQSFPLGALVLARERVRQHDGWWIRIWSGQWLQSSYAREDGIEEFMAERLNIEPSPDDVQQWLDSATRSKNMVLIENATEVAKQAGLVQDSEDKAVPFRSRQYSPRIKKNCC